MFGSALNMDGPMRFLRVPASIIQHRSPGSIMALSQNSSISGSEPESSSKASHVLDVEDSSNQNWQLQLYHALKDGEWVTVEDIIDREPEAVTARLTALEETPLLVAVKARRKYSFLRKLLDRMPKEALELTDSFGNTALHAAAELGDTEAVKLLLDANRDLLCIPNADGYMPINLAARNGHFGISRRLWHAREHHHNDELLHLAVTAGHYGFARVILVHIPGKDLSLLLELLAQEPSAFPSGNNFNIWQSLIYHCAPHSDDTVLLVYLWRVLEIIVKPMKHIRQRKTKHFGAINLIKTLCSKIKSAPYEVAGSIFKKSLLIGAKNGIHEIVKEILECFPPAIVFKDDENHSVLHIAVMYRLDKVFRIVHQRSREHKMQLLQLVDAEENNILHLAAHLPQQDQLDLSQGAVLQMQRELQWYMGVEKFVRPEERKSKNKDGKTPLALFNEEHRDLASRETQWMIGMASSCMVAASLIATVAFAASITIPGGYNSKSGIPMLSGKKAFVVFVTSDGLALLSSVTTVLAFLSIFTTRYTVNDFLYALPNRLITGLVALLVSVACLMMTFSCNLFLVGARSNSLMLIPIIALACVPLLIFALLQLPPLVSMIKSTYGPSIFE